MYFFLIGAICPTIAYLIHLRWPDSFIRYVKCAFHDLWTLRALTTSPYQFPCHSRWPDAYSCCDCVELRSTDNRWVHLQLLHPEETLFVVDQVQLYAFPARIR